MSTEGGSLRAVVIALGLAVVIVLGTQFLTIVFPPLEQALSLGPVLIAILLVVTAILLVRALRA